MKKADLHVRTTASVGGLSPTQVLAMAKKKGLAAVAIVDHETVDGAAEAAAAASFYGVEVIPGVELVHERGMQEVHIIGYFIDLRDPWLLSEVASAQMVRARRMAHILQKLRKLGIEISYEDVLREAGGARAIGRTHIARQMVRMEVVKDTREAFERYLGPGKPAYVPRNKTPLRALMRLIHGAGGVAAVAHPKFAGAKEFIPKLVKMGLKALEVHHPYHTLSDRRSMGKLAEKYGLLEVGGTDSGPGQVGDVTVPYGVVKRLKKFAAQRGV
jgi:hypothetical protein